MAKMNWIRVAFSKNDRGEPELKAAAPVSQLKPNSKEDAKATSKTPFKADADSPGIVSTPTTYIRGPARPAPIIVVTLVELEQDIEVETSRLQQLRRKG